MSERFSRQGFLGDHSEDILRSLMVGVVGVSGGGSHVVQQLAHVGVGHFQLYDPQRIDDSNLNRLVGATAADVDCAEWKTAIGRRVVEGVNPAADVIEIRNDWRNEAIRLRDCDVIVSCVDTYQARSELEVQARRYLIPHLDIGMDVHYQADNTHLLAGQLILSMPGRPCMRCVGFLREELLADEARRYGAAGSKPQVVWPNGILASLAVGVLVQLFTPWHRQLDLPVYLELDGNRNNVSRSNRLGAIGSTCSHFSETDLGDPWFRA
ncbi:MAG TPA: ThiF family adenylyltransferase [Candidatus Saccharimonadaceae bacterium]|jgi:hypothetical protein|nr:ThiF family adenylyltransferase [Candidatus Saccharimonadaceae bacterium]